LILISLGAHIGVHGLNNLADYLVASSLIVVVVLSLVLYHHHQSSKTQRRDVENPHIITVLSPVIKEFDTIKEILLMLLEREDHAGSAYFLSMAKAHTLRGQTKDAIATLKVLAEKEPNNPRVYSNLSYAYETEGDIQNAINLIERAIELLPGENHPKFPRYHFHKARYLAKLAETKSDNELWAQASTALKVACAKAPEYLAKATTSPEYRKLLEYVCGEKI